MSESIDGIIPACDSCKKSALFGGDCGSWVAGTFYEECPDYKPTKEASENMNPPRKVY